VNFNSSACANTGTASVTMRGGTQPYTYSWTTAPVQTTDSAVALGAGTYTVTVQDANACPVSASVSITAAAAVTANAVTNSNGTACNPSGGSATVTPGGGLGTYTFLWTGGQTNANAINLTAGTYTATVKDSNGCQATASTTITAPAALVATVSITTNASACANTGIVNAAPTGGNTPYTYLWSDASAQTNASATGLGAGSYTVNVQDADGCTSTASVTLTAPGGVTSNAVVNSNATACANVGSATASALGGTGAYTYSWSDPSGQTNATATGLSAGTYSVNITDANGCLASPVATVTITAPATAAASITGSTNSSACNNIGTATANATGLGPISYLWSDPSSQTNPIATGLSAGTYVVNVTDGNGCAGTSASVTITAPAALSQSNSFIAATCGQSNGSATVLVSGGTTPYTYSWAPGGQTNNVATNLSATTYTVTITDADNCQLTASVNVISIVTETITFTAHTDITCTGGNNGSITAVAASGAAPYTYSWLPSGGNTPTANNLTAGVYTLTVQDANGCSTSASYSITQPLVGLTASTNSIVSVTCSGDSNGGATASAAGGTLPYTYSWSPTGGNSSISTNLKSGTYTVSITDANGCATSATATIGNGNPSPAVNFSANSVSGCAPLCNEFTDNTTIAGGTLASWSWNFGDGNTSTLQNPQNCYTLPGAFTVSLTVTSNLGCSRTLSLHNMINVYSSPKAAFATSPKPATILNPTITFEDKSTDVSGISNWNWTFGDATDSTSINENPIHTYLDTGTYCTQLIVTNIKGCTDTLVQCLVINPVFSLYVPNGFTPNNDGKNEIFIPIGNAVSSFQMSIFDRWGTLLYTTNDITKGWDGKANGLPCGIDTYVYNIEVIDRFNTPHYYTGNITLIR
jgi:gliding motility-associated-like protein